MRFALSDEQRSIQKAVREFARGEFDDERILELNAAGQYPRDLLKKACRLEFVGVCYPESCGGLAGSPLDHVLVVEELCRKDSSVGVALGMADQGAELICALGRDDQKRQYLPRLAAGKMLAAVVAPDTDTDEACSSQSLKLERAAERWRLNGTAGPVFNAADADLWVVQCATDEGERFALVVPDSPGVSHTPLGPKLGCALVGWNELRFENVVLEESDLLKAADEPCQELFWRHQLLRLSAMNLGLAQGAYDQGLAYSKQREQFGRRICQFQGIGHKLVEMYRQVQAARALVYLAAGSLGEGRADLADMLTVHMQAEAAALAVTDEALQIHGGSGYMIELPVEHFYRDARMLQAAAGRRTFRKDVVARALIGRSGV